jgi:acetate kinase
MSEKTGKILVANIGSTSFKFRLFEMPSERLLARGGFDRIGAAEGSCSLSIGDAPEFKENRAFPDYAAAIARVEEALGGFGDLDAVGFKPVAAKGISGTQFLDEPVLEAMEAITTLFPAHNPPYVGAVRAFRAGHPDLPLIGTFETAFYDRLPEANRRFPVSREWDVRYGIRRTGFHGASHRYVTGRCAELRGTDKLKLISCHLGGSSSIAAVKDGVAINSSWGMTAQSGLPQNNRAGDFDAFALIYLIRDLGLGIDEVERVLSKESGLKGLSGLDSGDVRDLLDAAATGNRDAALALDLFVGRIRAFIGQFLVELGGADAILFTAGIAEYNPELRARICAGLEPFGIELDPAANAATRSQEAVISAPGSRVEVRVIPTNEELVIARNAWAKLFNPAN